MHSSLYREPLPSWCYHEIDESREIIKEMVVFRAFPNIITGVANLIVTRFYVVPTEEKKSSQGYRKSSLDS